GDLLLKPTAKVCRMLLIEILPDLRLIDPACGSGAFLVAAMRTLIAIYSGLLGHAKTLGDSTLNAWLKDIEQRHPSLGYFIKKQIIVNNLYGVDIMAEAVEIARLRLFLALVASAERVDDLEPLPNIDFNILAGNSLIGLLHVDAGKADAKRQAVTQLGLFDDTKAASYREVVATKNRLVDSYRHTSELLHAEDLSALRDEIQRHRAEAADLLDALLLDDFQALGIRYEEATWDTTKGKEGKPKKRSLTLADIRALQPFHWGYEFDEVMNERGGFDAIIANPPWEALKPDAKEFFADHSTLVSKKTMTVKDFEQEQAKLLQDREILDAWLAYLSRFPYQSEYFRSATQFQHQSAIVGGKRTGTDINFYKLFVEQCFNLLRNGGQCGIVVPSGIYTDLGSTGLRTLLFDQAQVRAILSVSNERFLFEGVDHRFKYVFMTFEKGGQTDAFAAAFRINPREAVGPMEIDAFLNSTGQHLTMNLDVVRHLSPETLSVMEFRSPADTVIAQQMLQSPTLGEKLDNLWHMVLTNELHMTNDSHLFKTSAAPGRIPLYEGKMIHQFVHARIEPKYWVEEAEGRKALLGKSTSDTTQVLNYQQYRLAFREIARNSDERSMIATILPLNVFANHKLMLSDLKRSKISNAELIYCTAVLNSLAL
ncbi:MAG: ATP-binding protein, partial [Oscillochloris sp.]|nr:ATP-binding protein [Oscillochloris sp.]